MSVMAGNLSAQDGGDDRGRQNPVGDAVAEGRALSVLLVDVQRIEIPRGAREREHVRFRDGLAEGAPIGDLQRFSRSRRHDRFVERNSEKL